MLKRLGFTFTELLIALLLSSLLLVALIYTFVSGLTNYNTLFKTNLLYTQLHAAMDVMVADIRRAGYWSQASTMIGSNANTNPFMSATTDISLGNSNTCILFAYDHTNSGTLPAISTSIDDLRYGYRLNGGAVQSRPWGANFSCSAAANNWTNITDPTVINVTTLNFALSTQVITVSTHTMTVRDITITLTGSLVSNSAITETLVETVRVANDKYT